MPVTLGSGKVLAGATWGGKALQEIVSGGKTIWRSGIDVADDFPGITLSDNWQPWWGHDHAKGLPQVRSGIAQPVNVGGSKSAGVYGALWKDPTGSDVQEAGFTLAKPTFGTLRKSAGMFVLLRSNASTRDFVSFIVGDGNLWIMATVAGKDTILYDHKDSNSTAIGTKYRVVADGYTFTVYDQRIGWPERKLFTAVDKNQVSRIGPTYRHVGFAVNLQATGSSSYYPSFGAQAFRAKG